jgi:hypothetical protein
VGDLLNKPRHEALPALQGLLMKALGDKQDIAFSGGATDDENHRRLTICVGAGLPAMLATRSY